MKIIHVAISIDRKSGGPSTVICEMALNQAKMGIDVVIFSTASADPFYVESPHTNLKVNFCDANGFKESLRQLLNDQTPDIIHLHGLWQIQIHYAARLARMMSIPYIITPHGTLHPWALNVKKWKKKLAMAVYQFADLKAAASLHATSDIEATYFRAAGLANPIAVIPNGVDLADFPISERQNLDQKTVLYLSRIHPQKGLNNLIDAWKKIDANTKINWQLNIAGSGENAYILELKELIASHGLADEVKVSGPKYGLEKTACFQKSDLFVLPSFSENFGIVVAEALASGIPVITTKGTPWQELETADCGWWIDIGAEPLQAALQTAITSDWNRLRIMGANGRKLVEKKYSIEAVASQTIALYDWVLNRNNKPEFIKCQR